MKFSRSYLFGLGSGLILSAFIAMVLPSVSVNNSNTVEAASVRETAQVPKAQEMVKPSDSAHSQSLVEKPSLEKTKEEMAVTPPTPKSNQQLVNTENEGILTIPAGASAEKIADILLSEGWIRTKEEFLVFVKEGSYASKFKAGKFKLSRGMDIQDIVKELIR
jgi:hypothetical protein